MGDFNGDGMVDAADYVVWRATLGQSGALLAADGNGNGQVDPGDYDVWTARLGQTIGSGATAASPAAVPEPAVLISFLPVIVVSIAGRLRRNSPGRPIRPDLHRVDSRRRGRLQLRRRRRRGRVWGVA
jgi:hypothetical protein